MHATRQHLLPVTLSWPDCSGKTKRYSAYLLSLASLQLQHPQVVEGLSMPGVECSSQPEALLRPGQVANANRNLQGKVRTRIKSRPLLSRRFAALSRKNI
jgi:hypothetical protein